MNRLLVNKLDYGVRQVFLGLYLLGEVFRFYGLGVVYVHGQVVALHPFFRHTT